MGILVVEDMMICMKPWWTARRSTLGCRGDRQQERLISGSLQAENLKVGEWRGVVWFVVVC